MEKDVLTTLHDNNGRFNLSLLSRQMGNHEDGIEDDVIDYGIEEIEGELPEGLCKARLLSLTRTTSKAVPMEQSSSGRIYQKASHCQQECLKPTMSIKSSWSTYASSVNPLPQRKGQSLMNWTPTANLMRLSPLSENSPSPKVGKQRSVLRRLMGKNGTTRQ
ncbi:P4 [Sauropus yellowing virus]|uniref:p4 n=1 Tax=Sauropus yellowing virus TaxID=1577997 RepID=A0A0A7E970_9VIRU|nr:P4 [Sauropus yellowing virus]AIY62172.1 P4 [Sauropus yellowing virus]